MLLLIEQPRIHGADYFVWEQKNGSWTSKAAELVGGLEERVAEME